MSKFLLEGETVFASSDGYMTRSGQPIACHMEICSHIHSPKEYALMCWESKTGSSFLLSSVANNFSKIVIPTFALPITQGITFDDKRSRGMVSFSFDKSPEIHLSGCSADFFDFLFLASEIASSAKLDIHVKGSSAFEWLWKYQPVIPEAIGSTHICSQQDEEIGDIKVGIFSWNCAGMEPPLTSSGVEEHFARVFGESLPEIIIFFLQETCPLNPQYMLVKENEFGEKWAGFLRKMGFLENYEAFPTESLVGLTSCIFVNKEHSERITNLSFCSVKTGFSGLTGNKGCVGTRFLIDRRISLALANVHFSSGDSMADTRKIEMSRIVSETLFPGGIGLLQNDVVFLGGDLNSRSTAENGDELKIRIANDKLFLFEEGEFDFPPTYKLVPGQEGVYHKERRPGWCDRILFRYNEGVQINQTKYISLPKITYSDHSPIFSLFDIKILQSEAFGSIRRSAD